MLSCHMYCPLIGFYCRNSNFDDIIQFCRQGIENCIKDDEKTVKISKGGLPNAPPPAVGEMKKKGKLHQKTGKRP